MHLNERGMNMESNYPVDPKNLSDKGTKGVMSSAAGLGMLGVNALLGVPVVGTVISAGLLALGATGLLGKTKTDKTSGTVLTVAGVAGLTTLFLPGLAHSICRWEGSDCWGMGYTIFLAFSVACTGKNEEISHRDLRLRDEQGRIRGDGDDAARARLGALRRGRGRAYTLEHLYGAGDC